jgi:predicted AlkP superfamily phosphohydrolase/phosphomutase
LIDTRSTPGSRSAAAAHTLNSNHSHPPQKQPKAVIIGLDAATWTLIRPWVAEGRLPTLARLMKEGVSATLESVLPPITPPAWTSFMTGKNQGKHGIFNFVQNLKRGSYAMHYVNGGYRRAATVFQLLNEAGLSAGTMNIPFTYPPEPLKGFQISGLDTPTDNSPFVYPASLHQELGDHLGAIEHDVRFLGYMSNHPRRMHVLAQLEKLDNQWTKAALYLLEHHPQDVMMFVFMSIDTVQHYFWQYMDPNHFLYDENAHPRLRTAVREVYERLDKAVGRMIQRLPADTTVFVVSDHGGGPVADRVVYLNRYLKQLGLLDYLPQAHSATNRLRTKAIRFVFSILRNSLSSRQKIFFATLFPRLRKKAELSYTSFNRIDWSRTKAYCSEVLAAPPSIRINLRGVKRDGIVEPADYDALCDFIIEKLRELKDPRTGKPIIARVHRSDEIFHGPFAEEAADLTLDWWSEDSLFSAQPSFPEESHKPPVVIRDRSASADKSEWGGTHRRDGILVARGPHLKSGAQIERARLMDVAPTLLHLFGVPIPEDMDGKVLVELFRPEFLAAQPVRTGGVSGIASRDTGYTDEERSKVEERLQALGYLE